MAPIFLSRPRTLVLLIALGIVATSLIATSDHHNYWGALDGPDPLDPPPEPKPPLPLPTEDEALLEKLAIIFPINNNTDMQFYRNTWMGDFLHPVCDWDEPECKIVCNKSSTYQTLDEKTLCFSRALRSQEEYRQKEFFLKLDDDSLVDKEYVLYLMRNNTGSDKPVYISDHTRLRDGANPVILDQVLYGNGKFYMFNHVLVDCLNTDFEYKGSRSEDLVFGGMVNSGCGGEQNILFIQEDDDYIWHKEYKNKNKYINLAFIKNH
ncbi:hypothetical protein FB645_000649 [Coemansia sp. IMI 203386]|nr:hypothetical protein FB645_000649 [Coemansia sp. IMI 203386]